MAPVGRLYRRTMWRTIWRTMWRGIWRSVWRGIWRSVWRGRGVLTWVGYGVWLAPVAYGWRLWRMVGAYGVWLAPVACRVRIVWTVYSVRLSSMCRAYVSSWLRLYADMVAPICRHGSVAMA